MFAGVTAAYRARVLYRCERTHCDHILDAQMSIQKCKGRTDGVVLEDQVSSLGHFNVSRLAETWLAADKAVISGCDCRQHQRHTSSKRFVSRQPLDKAAATATATATSPPGTVALFIARRRNRMMDVL